MRRALAEACLLFEDFGDAALAARVSAVDRGAQWTVQRGGVCVSRYEVGSEGRARREAFVTSEAWRALAAQAPEQPRVHWLAERGLAWPRDAGAEGVARALVYTVDVELLRGADAGPRRGVPARAALPDGHCWPVIGHPGRLLVFTAGPVADASALLAQHWGPAAEPVEVHALPAE